MSRRRIASSSHLHFSQPERDAAPHQRQSIFASTLRLIVLPLLPSTFRRKCVVMSSRVCCPTPEFRLVPGQLGYIFTRSVLDRGLHLKIPDTTRPCPKSHCIGCSNCDALDKHRVRTGGTAFYCALSMD
jgi:hypothetical protein